MGHQLAFASCGILFLLIVAAGPNLADQTRADTTFAESNTGNFEIKLPTSMERKELSVQRYEEWKRMVQNALNKKFVTIQQNLLATKPDIMISDKQADVMQTQHKPYQEETAENSSDVTSSDSFMPSFHNLSNQSKAYIVLANQHITESFLPLMGKEYASLFAYLIPFALLLLPLALALYYLGRVRAIFSLQKLLFAVNVYLGGYFAAFMISCFILKAEPMAFFQKNVSPSGFTLLLLIQYMSYLLYLLLEMVELAANCAAGASGTKPSALTHCTMATMVGLHYHLTVFQRGMGGQTPEIGWKIYGIYSAVFIGMCVVARTSPKGKRENMKIGRVFGDKKH